jgi:hypothetical protein
MEERRLTYISEESILYFDFSFETMVLVPIPKFMLVMKENC